MYRVRFFRGAVSDDEGLAKSIETFLNEGIQAGYELERIEHATTPAPASTSPILTVLVVLKAIRGF